MLDRHAGLKPKKTIEVEEPAEPKGQKLPQKEFRLPLLETLDVLGGSSFARRIRQAMADKMAPRLSEADYELVSSGDPRWWNAICWERNDCVKEGLLRDDSERGVWALSDKGKKWLALNRKR